MEGAELQILQSIPWDKVLIKVISVEVPPNRLHQQVHSYLMNLGYKFVTFIHNEYSHDNIYIHKSIPHDQALHD